MLYTAAEVHWPQCCVCACIASRNTARHHSTCQSPSTVHRVCRTLAAVRLTRSHCKPCNHVQFASANAQHQLCCTVAAVARVLLQCIAKQGLRSFKFPKRKYCTLPATRRILLYRDTTQRLRPFTIPKSQCCTSRVQCSGSSAACTCASHHGM